MAKGGSENGTESVELEDGSEWEVREAERMLVCRAVIVREESVNRIQWDKKIKKDFAR